MLIAGLGGHAREITDCLPDFNVEEFFFFEDIETKEISFWSLPINVIRTYEELRVQLHKNSRFILGTGNPKLRKKLFDNITALGGEPVSIVAASAFISRQCKKLGRGLNIMHHSFVSNNVYIGDGVLVNVGANIHHDCHIDDFCEISPNAIISGKCHIGKGCFIGANATILPNITIGEGAIIGAGSVVTKNVSNNEIVIGVPAKKK